LRREVRSDVNAGDVRAVAVHFAPRGLREQQNQRVIEHDVSSQRSVCAER
jgi:hypothetical protein